MGADFVEKATPTFRKSWDRARAALSTADLFTCAPSSVVRTAVAELVNGAQLRVGDRLTVEMQGKDLVARRGNADVARFSSARPELLAGVAASCGVAKGTVVQSHELAGVVEIDLC